MALPSPLSILTPIASLSAKRTRAAGYRDAISSLGTKREFAAARQVDSK
jgi:hypothetical protein